MRICVLGTGYVGLPTGACLAEVGNRVMCLDKDHAKISILRDGRSPIFEPGLDALLKTNLEEERLSFHSHIESLPEKPQVWIIAVGTPEDEAGAANLSFVFAAAEEIARVIDSPCHIVLKSTVPVGTTEKVEKLVRKVLFERGVSATVGFAFNPEFLKQGAAVEDTMRPDRIILGTDSEETSHLLKRLYAPFVRNHDRTLCMDIRSAEMTKYAANAMLATKISFMNEMANLCDELGADVEKVRVGIGSDSRIGYSFIYPGIGYGGSCFPKDVKALIAMARECKLDARILSAVDERNASQKQYMVKKICDRFGSDLTGRKFALWGLAFKPETDDMREATSIVLVKELLARGALVSAFDPVATENARRVLPALAQTNRQLIFCENQYEVLEGCDAMVLVTEWKPFRNPNLERMKSLMKSPVIFDGRNQYEPAELEEAGFEYFGVGRSGRKRFSHEENR